MLPLLLSLLSLIILKMLPANFAVQQHCYSSSMSKRVELNLLLLFCLQAQMMATNMIWMVSLGTVDIKVRTVISEKELKSLLQPLTSTTRLHMGLNVLTYILYFCSLSEQQGVSFPVTHVCKSEHILTLWIFRFFPLFCILFIVLHFPFNVHASYSHLQHVV